MMVSVVIRSLLVTQRRPILVILFIQFTFAIYICALISAIFIPCDSFRSSLFIHFSFYRGVFICLDPAFLCFFFFGYILSIPGGQVSEKNAEYPFFAFFFWMQLILMCVIGFRDMLVSLKRILGYICDNAVEHL